jgi:hypothetical protein
MKSAWAAAAFTVAAIGIGAQAYWNSNEKINNEEEGAAAEATPEQKREIEETVRETVRREYNERIKAAEAIIAEKQEAEAQAAVEKQEAEAQAAAEKQTEAKLITKVGEFLEQNLQQLHTFILDNLLPEEAEEAAATTRGSLQELFDKIKHEAITSYTTALGTTTDKLLELKQDMTFTIRNQMINFKSLLMAALELVLEPRIMNAFIALMTPDKDEKNILNSVKIILRTKTRGKKEKILAKINKGDTVAFALKAKGNTQAMNLYGALAFIDSAYQEKIAEVLEAMLRSTPLVPILCLEGMRTKADSILQVESAGQAAAFSDSESEASCSSSSRMRPPVIREEPTYLIDPDSEFVFNSQIDDNISAAFDEFKGAVSSL